MAKKKKSKGSQSSPQKTTPKHGQQQYDQEDEERDPKYSAIVLTLPSDLSVKKISRSLVEENEKVVYIHESDAQGFSVKQGEEVFVVQINVNDDRGPLSTRSKRGSWSPQSAKVSWKKNDDENSVQPRLLSICRVRIISGSGDRGLSPRSQSGSRGMKSNLPSEGEARLMPTCLLDFADSRDEADVSAIPDSNEDLELSAPTASTPSSTKSQFTFEAFVSSPTKTNTPSKGVSPQKKHQKKKRYIAIVPLDQGREAYEVLTGDAKRIELSLCDAESTVFALDVLKRAEKVLGRMVKALCNGKYFSVGENITISFQGKKLQFKISSIEWDIGHSVRGLIVDDVLTTSVEQMSIGGKSESDTDTLAKDINSELKKATSIPVLARVGYQTLLQFHLEDETNVPENLDDGHEDAMKPPKKVVAGLDNIRSKIQSLLVPTLFHPERFPRSGPIRAPKGVLVHGSSGCGKTLLAEQISSDIEHYDVADAARAVDIVHVNCARIQSLASIMGEAEKKLTIVFKRAERRALYENVSTLLIFDDIHLICPRRGAAGEGSGIERVESTLLALMDGIGNSSKGQNDNCGNIAILAITSNPSSLDPALRRAGRLDTEVEVPSPDDKAKGEILALCIERLKAENFNVPSLSDTELVMLSRMAKGFTGADCTLSIKEAIRTAISRHQANNDFTSRMQLTIADIQKAIRMTKPSAIKAVTVEIPRVPWSSIGGMEDVKRSLREAIELPLTHSHLFEALCIPPPRGVLLYGPPGCSKTLMARALATEGNMNFLAVKGPELLSKWLGESERALAALFRRARLASPCVIFFDEIDAIASKRGSGESSGGERMLSQLLTELDGVNSTSSSKGVKEPRVVVVGATNRPDLLDSALTRPGRIDRMIYVGVPDEETRNDIFQLQLKNKACVPDLDVSKHPNMMICILSYNKLSNTQHLFCSFPNHRYPSLVQRVMAFLAQRLYLFAGNLPSLR